MLRLFPVIWLLFPGILCGQSQHPATRRQIAARGGNSADRTASQEQSLTETANTALDLIGIQAGATVADVGARNGEFTWRLAERVGSAGRVYAVNSQPSTLDRIRKTVAEHGLNNVKITRATDQDPKLPAGKLDLVLLAGSYHGFTHPQDMIRWIRESLKPEGKLIVIEYRKEDQTLAVPEDERMSVQDIRMEIEPEGYKFEKVVGVLPHEHIVIFTKSRP